MHINTPINAGQLLIPIAFKVLYIRLDLFSHALFSPGWASHHDLITTAIFLDFFEFLLDRTLLTIYRDENSFTFCNCCFFSSNLKLLGTCIISPYIVSIIHFKDRWLILNLFFLVKIFLSLYFGSLHAISPFLESQLCILL